MLSIVILKVQLLCTVVHVDIVTENKFSKSYCLTWLWNYRKLFTLVDFEIKCRTRKISLQIILRSFWSFWAYLYKSKSAQVLDVQNSTFAEYPALLHIYLSVPYFSNWDAKKLRFLDCLKRFLSSSSAVSRARTLSAVACYSAIQIWCNARSLFERLWWVIAVAKCGTRLSVTGR